MTLVVEASRIREVRDGDGVPSKRIAHPGHPQATNIIGGRDAAEPTEDSDEMHRMDAGVSSQGRELLFVAK